MGSFSSSLTPSTVPSLAVVEETVFLEALDGTTIEMALVRTDVDIPRGTVVIAHPHPLHGGDRHNHVVGALQRAAHELECHSIAVNFRGVGASGGEHDHGDAERLDLAAACELAEMIEPDRDIIMAGYSFGAVVALNVTHPMIRGWLAVAPPLTMAASAPTASGHHRRKIVLVPEHDQFCPPDESASVTSTWVNTHHRTIAQVDHFIATGAHAAVTDALGELIHA